MRIFKHCTLPCRRIGVFAVMAVFSVSPAIAGDLIDNMNYATPNGNDDAYSNSFSAMRFKTTATEYIVNQVQANLLKKIDGTTGSFYFNIYEHDPINNKPSSLAFGQIYTGNIADLPDGGVRTPITASGLNVTLSPDTYYWLAVNSNQVQGFGWSAYNSGSPTALGFPSFWNFTSNAGASWGSSDSSYTTIFSVSAVPEPTTWAMGGIAMLTFGVIARKRRAQQLA